MVGQVCMYIQIQIKLRWALFVTYTIIQSIMRSEICSLHLTHPSGAVYIYNVNTLYFISFIGSRRAHVGGSLPDGRRDHIERDNSD